MLNNTIIDDSQSISVYDKLKYTKSSSFTSLPSVSKPRSIRRLRSRLSTMQSDMDSETKSNLSTDENMENIIMQFISINLVIDKSHKIMKTTSFLVNNATKFEKIIGKAISNLNFQLNKEKALFKLNEDSSKYGLKQSKKNGLPRLDLPCINKDVTLGEINISHFTLVWKDNVNNFDSYFVTVNRGQKKHCTKNCIIFKKQKSYH